MAVEPVQDDLEALDAVHGRPVRESSWLSPGNRTISTSRLQPPQRDEQLLALLDRAAQVVLGVQDQQRRRRSSRRT